MAQVDKLQKILHFEPGLAKDISYVRGERSQLAGWCHPSKLEVEVGGSVSPSI